MARSGLFSGLLASVFDDRRPAPIARDGRSIVEQSRELIKARGETATLRLARSILATYREIDDAGRLEFFQFLLEELDIDPDLIAECTREYRESGSPDALERLLKRAEPLRQTLFRQLNTAEGATATLVRMRQDILRLAPDHPDLKKIDLDLVHLFSSWFNRGFLVLRRIDWSTPAKLLEKVIEYEAVHQINDWEDLRRRTQPEDRRCYAYFHPRMPEDPLVFVEIALADGVPGSIQEVLSDTRSPSAATTLDTAIFYSISNCQPGLQGISFGESLIKHVVADLSEELPHLRTFITLSPIPGLRHWFSEDRSSSDQTGPDADEVRALAGHYLTEAKRGDGLPQDPVARFHLSNGAQIDNILAEADLSKNGIAQSFGAMVNYRYDLAKLETNSDAFAASGQVDCSRRIQGLARQGRALVEAKGNTTQ